MDPPTRIKALYDQGNSVAVDSNIPLRRYYRSAMEMSKMAKIYEEEGSYESAYILYIRYITLFVDKIRDHPEYQNYLARDKAVANKRVKEILLSAENLKVKLKERYQREYSEAIAHQHIIEEQMKKEREDKLRREKEREEQTQKILEADSLHSDKWDNIRITPYDVSEIPSLNNFAYPTDSLSGEVTQSPAESLLPPPYYVPPVPSRDLKPGGDTFSERSLPAVDRDTKPLSLLSPHLDAKGSVLRTVIVPQKLMDKFLDLSIDNSSRNIETCGILAGKLTKNKFMITHLLVPQQVGTPDSCTTQHEEELFDQQDKFDLITLGWIHTHPSQTAFLSSVDLHTHCSYQLMMPEAVAIVCAPKFNETGYFTLTQNHGLSFIANCHESGFHPHPSEPPLFQNAQHIVLDSKLPVHIVDLRV